VMGLLYVYKFKSLRLHPMTFRASEFEYRPIEAASSDRISGGRI